jgi:hypothetical protein
MRLFAIAGVVFSFPPKSLHAFVPVLINELHARGHQARSVPRLL